jgi:hypothetical protein
MKIVYIFENASVTNMKEVVSRVLLAACIMLVTW